MGRAPTAGSIRVQRFQCPYAREERPAVVLGADCTAGRSFRTHR